MHFKFIVNPAAGRGDVNKLLPKLRVHLNKIGLSYEMALTKSPGHAIEMAREATQSFQVVVAVGGDGTVNEVIDGIMGTDTILGIIPLGTGNDLARTLNIPFSLEKSTAVLKTGRTTAIDIGKDIDGYFSCILGIGFPSDVMHHANTSTSLFRGSTAIKASIVQVVNKLQPYSIQIETDTESFPATVMGVFILNTRFTGGGVQIAPNAEYDDGLFDLVIMHEMSKLDFFSLLPKAFKGNHVGHAKVQILRTKRVKITTPKPMRKDFDGNISGVTPVDAHILPAALQVLIP